VSVHDMCTLCANCTVGSKIILDKPMVVLGDETKVDAQFGPFGDNVSVSA
jgi:hypothetical protein